MKALIVNDDGIDSPGLALLARLAVEAGFDVQVAAPHVERSGASASLTALQDEGKLLLSRRPLDDLPEVESYAVEASPALITFLASYGAFGTAPDIVLSGINLGPNTGHAILHSGTVGAALTAATHGARASHCPQRDSSVAVGDRRVGDPSRSRVGRRTQPSGHGSQRQHPRHARPRVTRTAQCSSGRIRCRPGRDRGGRGRRRHLPRLPVTFRASNSTNPTTATPFSCAGGGRPRPC